ncbi:heavy metal translocating P-type ATPase [Azohydromonas caseinilytica]|uniref:HAD-IC family P-type ATPase n=1 Tax=Azohydromonas caseinilytica TaxID=2728836 RepID=A0A848F8N5_9BURK|nr:HAD-IC family P-type ATPase [Azohydromonas caseinilytica]NML14703.1 HAD-IC family P-type ATPase [Azohydromonas caseinilytica]
MSATPAIADCSLPIEGLNGDACVARVQRALAAVPGVRQADVNLAAEAVHVQAEGAVSLKALRAAVQRAGYRLSEQQLRLRIEGLSCAACGARVERVLQRQPGVISAGVNVATGMADVVLAARDPELAGLEQAVARAGFQVRPVEEEGAADMPRPDPAANGAPVLAALLLAAPLALPLLGPAWTLPGWLQLLLATPLQLLLGARFYRSAWQALRTRGVNTDLLVALGTSAAYGLSVWLLATGGARLHFGASAGVIALVLLGRWLEARAKQRAGATLRALRALQPASARVRREDGREADVPLARLRGGDLVVLRPGERIAVDGDIVEGRGEVDDSPLTGARRPGLRGPGERVSAGAVNGASRLLVRATGVGADSTLARLVRRLEAAQAAKAPAQRVADRACAWLVPGVLALALLTLLGWGAATHDWQRAVLHAVAVLLVASPCALGLAVPAALLAGTGVAARHGILIRDIQALELAQSLSVVAFDPAGTFAEDCAEAPGGGDRLKEGAVQAVRRLHAMDIDTVLLSGDAAARAGAVARALGIAEVRAGVPPQDRAAIVAGLRARGRVALVGDGLDDAPALAAADVGIAMAGADGAVPAAGITLLRRDPALVADAIAIARRTGATLRQNLGWAGAHHLAGLPLAAFGLLDPVLAGAAMAFSSVVVLGNALALQRWRPGR